MKKLLNELAANKFFAANECLAADMMNLATQYEGGNTYYSQSLDIIYADGTCMQYRMSVTNPYVSIMRDGKYVTSESYVTLPEAVAATLLDDAKITSIHALEYSYVPEFSEYYGELPLHTQYSEYHMEFNENNEVKSHED
ncbi:MAG: hypothetical protein MJY95_05175 [Bacteroidaceae bacterium]|nr:hypothetical protein [Bacteroidaceae bacterium]